MTMDHHALQSAQGWSNLLSMNHEVRASLAAFEAAPLAETDGGSTRSGSLRLRTTDPRNRLYRANGALGVRVCKEWREFEAFRPWALGSGWKQRLRLARLRIRGPYSPANCRWVTRGVMSERYRSVWRR